MKYGHYCQFGCKTTLTIILAPRECLLEKEYYILVWQCLINLRLSRRELADELVNLFRDTCCVEILNAKREEYILPEFDDIFTYDGSRRWFGTFIQPDNTGERPAHYTKIIPRLEVMDAAAKIINPSPFRAIGHTC